MALKMDRQEDEYELGYFVNEVAERGNIVSISTAGSGVAMDNPANLATVQAASSGAKPLGFLMNDFVNTDPTRVDRNWFKDEARPGDKATILTRGWVVTNRIAGTPIAGNLAALASSGAVTGVAIGTTSTAVSPIVGRFMSAKDENGYAKVKVTL